MSWNAEQYLRFGGHRLRPVFDLIGGVDVAGFDFPPWVIDLGCGPQLDMCAARALAVVRADRPRQ